MNGNSSSFCLLVLGLVISSKRSQLLLYPKSYDLPVWFPLVLGKHTVLLNLRPRDYRCRWWPLLKMHCRENSPLVFLKAVFPI